MATNFVEREIGNNAVHTYDKKKITTLLGAKKVTVGVEDKTRQVVKENAEGHKYLANAVDAQQVYNLSTQVRGCWFTLDLETGRNNQCWYPGSKQVADAIGENIELKAEMSDASETVEVFSNAIVDIEGSDKDASGITWYKVKHLTNEGYLKSGILSNFRYIDRED